MIHPRYLVAEEERARKYRAAEFAQCFERPPGFDPASYDNAPPFNEADCGGAFDGFSVSTDAEGNL